MISNTEQAGGDWAAHHFAFLELRPTISDLLASVAEAVDVDGYKFLDTSWYVKELKSEGDEMVGNRTIGIGQIQPN